MSRELYSLLILLIFASQLLINTAVLVVVIYGTLKLISHLKFAEEYMRNARDFLEISKVYTELVAKERVATSRTVVQQSAKTRESIQGAKEEIKQEVHSAVDSAAKPIMEALPITTKEIGDERGK